MFGSRIFILVLGDILALILSLFLMLKLRVGLTESENVLSHIYLFAGLFALWLIVFFVFDLYNIRRTTPTPRTVGLLIAATTANTLLGVLFFYIFNIIAPKTNLIMVSLFSLALLILWRRMYYHLFTNQFKRKIILLGNTPALTDLAAELQEHPQLGEVVFCNDCFPEKTIAADLVISSNHPKEVLSFSRSIGAEILSIEKAYEILFGKINLDFMNEEKALSILSKEQNKGLYVFSRLIEIAIASFVLILTSPILLLAMLAIYIEDGFPIFYTQKRVGKNGTIFTVYKLRTMKKDAEKNGAMWATKNDTRITKLGALLRKTHIDEIPQMLNIIKGDIALVGPRPERPEFVSELEQTIPYYFLRHAVRPGFTGWAQIKYRYARTLDDSKEKFEYDLYYLQNKNTLLDTGIILKTIQIIFTH